MRYIYLSPHLDDSSLSVGGLIYEQTQAGIPVEIWTFMCGYPPATDGLSSFAQALHKEWATGTAKETIDLRRAENEKSAALLGAKTYYFDFLDCIYRHDQNGTWLYNTVFTPPHAFDEEISSQITLAITARLKPDDVLVCQFGLGSHVDHVLVRRAAESLNIPLLYLADIPYLFNHPDTLTLHTAGLKEKAHSITESGLQAWKEAIRAYSSQISSLFDSTEHMHSSIEKYCTENNGVRLWKVESK